MMKAFCAVLLALAVSWVSAAPAPEKSCNPCTTAHQFVGCYKDKPDRALPDLILTDRDHTSRVTSGVTINWHDWDNYIVSLACRCAEKAKELGHEFFGLQFYGECWSGDGDYGKYGKIKNCATKGFQQCQEGKHKHCVGNQWANMVYKIVPSWCKLKFKAVNCFADKHKQRRPLPQYLLTDRERSLSVYSGKDIDWTDWDMYIPNLACRCAQKTKEKGYKYFGLQYYGECWSGNNPNYSLDGATDRCINQCYGKCNPEHDKFCTGKQHANFVYEITE